MKLFSAFFLSFVLMVGCGKSSSSNSNPPPTYLEDVVEILQELKDPTTHPAKINRLSKEVSKYDNLIVLHQGKNDCNYLDCFGVYLTTTEKLKKAFNNLQYDRDGNRFIDWHRDGFKKLVEKSKAYKIGTTREVFLEYVNIHGMYPYGNSEYIYVIWSSDRIKDFEDF